MRALTVAIAVAALAGCAREPTPEDKAYLACVDFLKASAKNPSSAEIPKPAKVSSTDYTLTLEWPHGAGLRFMNNMGAMLDTTATCVTNRTGIMVEELEIDGKVMFKNLAFREIEMRADGRLTTEMRERDLREHIARERNANPASDAAFEAAAAAADAAAEAAAAAADSGADRKRD